MAENLRPEDIRIRKFGVARRGYDRKEVAEYLVTVGDRVSDLESELSNISSRLDQLGIAEIPDFKVEMDELGAEIQAVLAAALTAAEGMRVRARDDADHMLSDAEATSTATRGDAWEAGTGLLEQAEQTAGSMLAEAREDALFIRAEAEQDAKRLVSDARKQADEMIRSSREEGEKIVVIAKAESEAILEGARQSAEKAQERARALENRRAELLGELEAAESAIRDIEESKAQAGPAVGPRVTAGQDPTHWPEEDGAIRILPAEEAPPVPAPDPVVDAEEMAAEVARLRGAVTLPQQDDDEPEPAADSEPDAKADPDAAEDATLDPDPLPEVQAPLDDEPSSAAGEEMLVEDEPVVEPPPAAEPVDETDSEPEPAKPTEDPAPEPGPATASATDKVTVVEDDSSIAALFAKLRGPGDLAAAVSEAVQAEREQEFEVEFEQDAVTPPLRVVPDLEQGEGFERRDRMLLPIENGGLRGLKRRIVELQNRVLEELRTSGGEYRLGREFVVEMMGDELDLVLQQSFAAAHVAAADSVGAPPLEVVTGGPNQGAAEEFSNDLHDAVRSVISRGRESGSRRLSSDVGRVFRAWRTDEAERHVRVAARRSFNDGLIAAYKRLGVGEVEYAASGRPCGECAADSGVTWAPVDDIPPGGDVPPIGPTCSAMVVPRDSNGFDSRPEQ